MIDDLDLLDTASPLSADICIIGSGAAGVALAREFIGSKQTVLVLEGGGGRHEPRTHELYRSHVVGLPHTGIHEGRARTLGGTTTLWAGQALPLCPIDFEARSWVPRSGWPLNFEDLQPFYRRAEAVMQLPTQTYDERAWPEGGTSPPDYDRSVMRPCFSQFAREPNFAKMYAEELRAAPNVRVILHANAIALNTDPMGQTVTGVSVRSLSGKSATVTARVYLVCCGGIETARLLLASPGADGRGVGNQHDLVGRYFQDHIHVIAAPIQTTNRKRLAKLYAPFKRDGIKFLPRFVASEELQRREHILNASGDVTYPPEGDSPVEAAKDLLRAIRQPELRSRAGRAFGAIARRPDKLAVAAFRHYVSRQSAADTSGTPYLGIAIEQEPNPESRVYLGEETDELGMRRTVLDWRLTARDRRTVEVFARAAAKELERLGLGCVDLADFALPEDLHELGKRIHDAYHHIGTARMSDDPNTGVVDKNLRVHGVDNLYVASSAVFPTGGFSNPTLTILALCTRLSDHLKARVV